MTAELTAADEALATPWTIHNGDALDAYESWDAPNTIISDGAYGVGGFPGDPRTPENLGDWYAPHIEAWSKRGYALDVVLYRKYRGSPYVDPQEPGDGAFRDLPDRFPSVLSRDFRREAGEYEDYDNLFAMYLLRNLARAEVVMDGVTGMLRIEMRKSPMPYVEAVARARADAAADETDYSLQRPFAPQGARIGERG